MCHLVTMVLPPEAQFARVEPVLARYHRGFEIVENRHLARILEPGEIYFCPSPKHCDCGTALGSMRQVSDTQDLTGEIKKRKRKGWGEAKITRWLEQQEKNRQAKTGQTLKQNGAAGEPDDWLDIVRELRAEARLPYVGIMLHFYSGPLSERIDATRVETPFEETGAATLLYHMDEDVVYILS